MIVLGLESGSEGYFAKTYLRNHHHMIYMGWPKVIPKSINMGYTN
jgi:hypothetical protein